MIGFKEYAYPEPKAVQKNNKNTYPVISVFFEVITQKIFIFKIF